LHDFIAGRPTREIATELDLDYGTVLKWRHILQDTAEGIWVGLISLIRPHEPYVFVRVENAIFCAILTRVNNDWSQHA